MADDLLGADAFIEQLVASGVRLVFGNPGTTEQPFLGRLWRYPELRFVTALHESVAVCAAEGFARATGTVGVVELHAGPGLGNGLGMLYNAAEGRTPLVVYVGQVEQASQYLEPTLGGDLVAMAHPVAKWAHEVRTVAEIPQIVRRAVQVASTPPCGPVVLSIPMDLMERQCDSAVAPTDSIRTAVRPDPRAVAGAADVIARADAPVLIVGDGVARSGAIDEVSAIAELIGAPIFGGFMTETCIDPSSPLNGGRLPSIEGAAAARALRPYDCVVAVGTKLLSQVFPVPGWPVGERDVVHIGLEPWELAKNQPSTVVFGDEAAALRDLTAELEPRLAARREAIDARRAAAEAAIADAAARARAADESHWDDAPMSPERAVAEIAALLPAGAYVVDESITAYPAVSRYVPMERGRWFRLRGGGIGAGMPMPIGLQLADPAATVVAFVGDGSAIYTLSALWTAAHERLPITWFILNNASYRVLKENARRESPSTEAAERLVGADLADPELDFVSLARGFGVLAHRVTNPDQIREVVPEALAADHPVLIDVSISGALTKR
jgi:benzoylformate decarboxylase